MSCVRATIDAVEKQWILHNLSVCVFVVLGIQHEMRMHHTAICGLPRSTVIFHIMWCVVLFPLHYCLLNVKM